jgi:pimeloyl-ACP methyl ester carboxylesterase
MDLAYERRGTGPPLVLIHGTGSRRQVWAPVLDRLAAQRDVIAPDLPGFGRSPPHPEPVVTPELYAEAVTGLLDRLGLETAHVAGNSLGGGVALVLGARGRARSVTALSPIGFWTPQEAEFCRSSILSSVALSRALSPLAPVLLGNAVGRAILLSQLIARPSRMPATDAIESSRAFARAQGTRSALDGYRRWRFVPSGHCPFPVTIAWAERDRLLLSRQAQRARRAVPGARHVTLRGCGHLPMWDDPDQVAEVLLEGSRTG